MTRESDEYELFVARLIEDIKKSHRSITNLGCGSNNLIKGACDQKHQIDVSFIDNSFEKPTLVIIECKRRRKPIDLGHVKVLKATLDDILASDESPSDANAIMVSTNGARIGAKRYADYYGILIEELPHGNNFIFKYENIIQAGIAISLKATVEATATVLRTCSSCGSRFEVIRNEKKCPSCSA